MNTGFDEALLQQLATQHSPYQQMWLSGYLYAIAQQQNGPNVAAQFPGITQTPAESPLKIRILFGSQTGNSKKVAALINSRLKDQGFDTSTTDLNDYQTKDLKSEKIVLLVVSTQGDGEPPTAAEEFYKWLNGPRATRLEGVQFAVCALGDKSYPLFCQTGKDFDQRFEALGASRLANRADCDVDYEEMAEAWASNVLEKIGLLAHHQNGGNERHPSPSVLRTDIMSATTTQYSRKNPFQATILEKIQLNGRGSTKETWHLELSLQGAGLYYQPGDSLGVFAANSDTLVKDVLYTAMLNGDKILPFDGKEARLRDILKNDTELTVITRDVLEKYADWTNNARIKAILSDPLALKSFLWGRNFADLLREFPTALGEASLLNILRKMPPRMYSISSSLNFHPDEVHLTVAAVRYQYGGREHLGVASTYLADGLNIGDKVAAFVEENEYFKLPTDDHTDIIMVGPGTGVAPFRAFVEERAERGARGRNWLFFGNPHFDTDFLYQAEWLSHLKRGTLDRLDVAFSRDQKEKIYVQHRLEERSKLLFERLENGACFYVCGDKNKMAADVQACILQLIKKESGKDEDYALEYLKQLKKQRRYLEDVY